MLLAIAIGTTIVAIVMSVVAWRASSAERARSAARVEVLARAIDGEHGAAPLDLTLRHRTEPVLSAPPASGAGSRLGLSLAAGAFVVTAAAAAAIVFSSESPTASANPVPAPRPVAEAPPKSLELVSLDHERTGDTLVVHGVVRNPTGGLELDALAAVVTPIGFDGSALSSVRSPVDSTALAPGGQSAFAVTIPKAAGVGRYRVSFRAGDRIVSHVDKRIGS
jgi:hypothetical protein